MAEIKTKATTANVEDFIKQIPDEQKQKDSFELLKIMQKATGDKPKMWGASIIGFGHKKYKSPTTGREVDWFIIGFSPRKAALSVYLVSGLQQYVKELKQLGKHKTGAGCLYVNKLSDVNMDVLKG